MNLIKYLVAGLMNISLLFTDESNFDNHIPSLPQVEKIKVFNGDNLSDKYIYLGIKNIRTSLVKPKFTFFADRFQTEKVLLNTAIPNKEEKTVQAQALMIFDFVLKNRQWGQYKLENNEIGDPAFFSGRADMECVLILRA